MNATLLGTGLLVVGVCGSAAQGARAGEEPAAREAPRGPVSVVHEASLEFTDDELRFCSVFEFRSHGGLASATFTLPEGACIDHVEAPLLAGYSSDADAFQLDVSFLAPAAGRATVTIHGHVSLDPEIGLDAVLLPVLEPQNVDRETGRLHLFAPPGLNLAVDRELAVGAAPAAARPDRIPDGMRHIASWAYRRRPVELLVETSRESLRMTASIDTEATVHPRYVDLRSRVEFCIESGQADVFHVALPPSVSDHVRIEPADGTAVAQQTRGEPLDDGWVPWTIVTREPVTDRVAFDVLGEVAATAESARPIELISHEDPGNDGSPADGTATTGRVLLELPRAIDPQRRERSSAVLRRVEGRLAVRAGRELAVQVRPTSGAIEPVAMPPREDERHSAPHRTLDDWPSEAGNGSVVCAFHYGGDKAAWELTWSQARLSAPIRPPVAILRACVEIDVPEASGECWAGYRCRYLVESGEDEFLRIEIPAAVEGSDVKALAALCNGRPVPIGLETDADASAWRVYRVQTARQAGTGDPFWLTVTFRVKLPAPPFRGFGSPLELPLPRLGGRDAAVQGAETVLWIPRDYAIVGTPHGFEQMPGEDVAALSTTGRRYAFHSTAGEDVIIVNWWNMRLATWVLSGAALLAAIVLRPTPWRNRLTFAVLLGFAVAMLGVAAPAAVAHGVYAGRFGIAAGLLLWIAGSLPGRFKTGTGTCH
ncbi:MAG TPA: hypothetical protein VML55_18510 [Planctomycetaceae bacterium]|nr:hypothetical protein [Planctomycetaceae bacterium]